MVDSRIPSDQCRDSPYHSVDSELAISHAGTYVMPGIAHNFHHPAAHLHRKPRDISVNKYPTTFHIPPSFERITRDFYHAAAHPLAQPGRSIAVHHDVPAFHAAERAMSYISYHAHVFPIAIPKILDFLRELRGMDREIRAATVID